MAERRFGQSVTTEFGSVQEDLLVVLASGLKITCLVRELAVATIRYSHGLHFFDLNDLRKVCC